MRVAMLTGGGDCPGLNAVMRAVARKGERTYGDELVGFLLGQEAIAPLAFAHEALPHGLGHLLQVARLWLLRLLWFSPVRGLRGQFYQVAVAA